MKEKVNGLFDQYKKFALKGNVMDLAIAVVLGGAFGRIIQSLVNNLIMPLLSLLIGEINFVDLKVVFKPAMDTKAEVALQYGSFIQVVIEFLIISIAVFFIFLVLSKLRTRKEVSAAPVEVKPTYEEIQIKLLEEIRDSLKK